MDLYGDFLTDYLSEYGNRNSLFISSLATEIRQALQAQNLDIESIGIVPHELICEGNVQLSVSSMSLPRIRSPHSSKSWLSHYMMLTFIKFKDDLFLVDRNLGCPTSPVFSVDNVQYVTR